MESFGDSVIVAGMIAPGQGPMAQLYRSRWEDPEPERDRPLRARFSRVLVSLARAIAPAPNEQRPRRVTEGAAP